MSGSSPHTRGAHIHVGFRYDIARIIPAYAGSTDRQGRGVGARRDHPRIRGEHVLTHLHPGEIQGSSPHTRGAPAARRNRPQNPGIIPAYAGSTPDWRGSIHREKDHPRIRGEHSPTLCFSCPCVGSSPHTRGAQRRLLPPHDACRIIPAYAGSTPSHRAPAGTAADHPRIRGEHGKCCESDVSSGGIIPAYAGSTRANLRRWRAARDHPRIRGEHVLPFVRNCPRSGIIPAYAGSTSPGIGWAAPGMDHPRIRGEHEETSVYSFSHSGSSPHTRGARRRAQPSLVGQGIIPAYAGSTMEYSERIAIRDGSSPHTRGARESFRQRREDPGIIPAYAGSTHPLLQCAVDRWDHPRIRGEHEFNFACDAELLGSSPHTRGARVSEALFGDLEGIIPAYAGSTRAPTCG